MNENANIVEIGEAEFNDQVIEASSKKLIIVDFWAPWCGPCKQLTPILEKVIKTASDKVTLIKINIDENQQIAGQLRIQSIPTVYAFKDKQIVNAFQGVLPEKQIIEFIEKCLGSKIQDNYSEFYEQVRHMMSEKKFDESKEALLEFISSNPEEILGIKFYLECLIELKQFEEIDTFISSLKKETQDKEEILQIIKKVKIIKDNIAGPDIEELENKLKQNPGKIDLVIEIADKHFSNQNYQASMEILLKHYPKNKNRIKEKMVEFFGLLGNNDEYTIQYRKKLSQIMFS
tara:strand:+ start:1 stop:867 length:867 start_codon:yes stop_codon:yes gene_type:complete